MDPRATRASGAAACMIANQSRARWALAARPSSASIAVASSSTWARSGAIAVAPEPWARQPPSGLRQNSRASF